MDRPTILTFTVEALKQQLRENNLSIVGRKLELQNRLLQHLGLEVVEEEEEFMEAQEISSASHFTLKDVQESLSCFDGRKSNIEQWLTEFEDSATAVLWNDLQKFIYAKQLLKGAASIFIRSQSNINSWRKLKTALIEEFGSTLSTAEIHKILSNRKKRYKETCLEYLYSIMEIAKPINLEEQSIIEYFVEGLPDLRQNKAILFEAQTLQELKLKIKIYEKIKLKSYESNTNKNDGKRTFENKQNKTCNKCPHLNNHHTSECRKLNNCCFKCGKTGHKAADCRGDRNNYNKPTNAETSNSQQYLNNRNQNNNPYDQASSSNNQINIYDKNKQYHQSQNTSIRMFKELKIQNHKCSALLDTGSDLCLLSKSVFDQLQALLFPYKTHIWGVGKGKLETLGYIITKIEIDNIIINWTLHIVNDNDIMGQCIIGNDILEIVDIYFSSSGTTICLKKEQETLEELLFNEMLGCKKEPYNKTFTAGLEFNEICTNKELHPEDSLENVGRMSKKTEIALIKLMNEYIPSKNKISQVKTKIVLLDETPIHQSPRRLAYKEEKMVEKQIDEWLKDGIIQPSYSQFAAPIVLVPKKDGSKRICCDFRKINKQIIKDNFPMAIIDDVIAKLSKAKIFSTIDLKNGFFHVMMDEESRKYTSFVTHYGQYEFLRTPFGMKNSPASFCRFIADVFHNLIRRDVVVVYMDDIVIPAWTEQESLEKLTEVLTVASDFGIEINWKKCQFIKTEINFLGYKIKNGTIKPSEEKVKAVLNYKVPTDVKTVQRFLGLTSYFRRFISQFSIKAKPLSDLLCKNVKFQFENEQKLAFEELKQALISAPVLKIFNIEAETEVHTDASKYGYGAVLLQKDSEDQAFHPVEYMSRKTTPVEENYHSYELEVLAIVAALKKWRVFLLGIQFSIITDCNAFSQTVNKKEVPARIARWVMFLQDFQYKIEHRPAAKLRHADALSRVYSLLIQSSLKHSIIEAQKNDEYTAIIRNLVTQQGHKDFYIKNNILFKDPSKEQVVIPQAMEKDIIEFAHKQGHYATKKTADIIEKNYYIKDLIKKTDQYVKNCIQCILANTKAGKKEGLLNPIDKFDKPLQTLHVDHLGPMETTKKMYNYILTIVDAFTKFTWIFPTKTLTAEETVAKLEKITAIFGNPERIISDRGSAFTSNLFTNFCKNNEIKHHLITTGVPRGNGQVERLHKVIISMLTKLSAEKKQCWYKHTDKVQQFINSTPSRSTKVPPFKLLTGMDMRLSKNMELRKIMEEELIAELDEDRDSVRLIARDNIHKIQAENKKGYDKNRQTETNYEIGSLVAIKRTQFGTGLKLKPKFLGPYKVIGKKTLGRYEVEKLGQTEGPNKTITTAEYMKKWTQDSGANLVQDGRM